MSLKNTIHWINQKEIQSHISELKKYPPLTKEQEDRIIANIVAGDERGKDMLILSNMRFVVTIAKKYQNQGLPFCDLVAEGNLGLVKAAQRYDYKGQNMATGEDRVRFLSYAVHWIKQSITECLHQNSRTIRLPANLISEICKSSSEPLGETVYDYTLTFPKMMSFDVSVDDDGNTLYEIIRDDTSAAPDQELDNPAANIKGSLRKIMSFLKEGEQFVVIKAYGLDGEAWTLQDIAERMDLTKERVRQIKEKAIKKLRQNAPHLMELVD